MKLLIIIPAYNEQDSIVDTVEGLIKEYPQADYVIVNDHSTDNTEQICRHNGFNLITLPTNLGLAGAFQAGLKYAQKNGYDMALQFDADGQHLPQYILPMAQAMENQNADIIIGSRFCCAGKPKSLRMLGSDIISKCIYITTRAKITDPTSGMRLFNSAMIARFSGDANFTPEPDTIAHLIREGKIVAEYPVTMHERTAGKSYLTPAASVKYMLKTCISILIMQWFV